MIIIIIIKRFGLYYQPCIQATRLKTRSPTGNRATSATSQRLFVAILRGPVTLEHGFIHYVILCLQHVHVLGPGCWGGVGGGRMNMCISCLIIFHITRSTLRFFREIIFNIPCQLSVGKAGGGF
jgi:hypothetical protein